MAKETGLFRRRTRDDRADHRLLVVTGQLDADADERARERLLGGLDLVSRHERRVPLVAHRVGHPPDGAVGELPVVEVLGVDVVVLDGVPRLLDQRRGSRPARRRPPRSRPGRPGPGRGRYARRTRRRRTRRRRGRGRARRRGHPRRRRAGARSEAPRWPANRQRAEEQAARASRPRAPRGAARARNRAVCRRPVGWAGRWGRSFVFRARGIRRGIVGSDQHDASCFSAGRGLVKSPYSAAGGIARAASGGQPPRTSRRAARVARTKCRRCATGFTWLGAPA